MLFQFIKYSLSIDNVPTTGLGAETDATEDLLQS
jgi:hypothetical protein